MQLPNDRRLLDMRDLLESTGTRFTVAGCGRRAIVFRQGDACCGLLDTGAFLGVFLGEFKKLGFVEEDGGVFQVNPSLLHAVRSRCLEQNIPDRALGVTV